MKRSGLIAIALAASTGALPFEGCTSHLPSPLEVDGGGDAETAADVMAVDGGGDSPTADATADAGGDSPVADSSTPDDAEAGALDAAMDGLVDVTAQ
jgi:hypothetical protein